MKFKFKVSIRREVKIITAIIIVGAIIAFTERRQGSASVRDITIKMKNAVASSPLFSCPPKFPIPFFSGPC